MFFPNVQYRLFLDELFLLKENHYCMNFKDTLKAHVPFLTFEKNHGEKRRLIEKHF